MKNNQFWFWGFIVLATILISAITTLGIKIHHFHKPNTEHIHTKDSKYDKTEHKKRSKKRDEFNFTKQEKDFFNQERKEHREKLHIIKKQQKLNKSKLFKEISKANPNTDSVNVYKNAILKSNEAILDETINNYEALKNRLNPEQMKLVNKHVLNRLRKI